MPPRFRGIAISSGGSARLWLRSFEQPPSTVTVTGAPGGVDHNRTSGCTGAAIHRWRFVSYPTTGSPMSAV